ncbi:MAG: hypothetical protein PHO96_03845 [Candidatus Izemoplasmatales bacterium]|jgi:hypothetical protein|nr:hypothetical protein [Candidatus Izemoplasmatales bacterium]
MKNKQADKAKLDEFFTEVGAKKKDVSSSQNPHQDTSGSKAKTPVVLTYTCPSCRKMITSRKEPCKYCGYKGYIPLNEKEIKKIRFIMFFVILVIALAVYFATR